jgi:hypothetical protein
MKAFPDFDTAEAWCAATASGPLVLWLTDEYGDEAVLWNGSALVKYTMSASAAALAGVQVKW